MIRYPCEYIDITSSNIQDIVKNKIGNRFQWHSTESGIFCLSKARHSNLYSVLIWKNGGWLNLYDGFGRLLVGFPSLFTGSFVICGYAQNGLYARVGAYNNITPANTLCWLEQDD